MNSGYDFSDGSSAVRSLQKKLREIQTKEGKTPTVFIDGIYGKETANAVAEIQSEAGMGKSGYPDFETFRLISEKYGKIKKEKLPFENGKVSFGENSQDVILMQTFLDRLSAFDDNFAVKVSGTFDGETLRAVNRLQKVLGKEESGTADEELLSSLMKICENKKSPY